MFLRNEIEHVRATVAGIGYLRQRDGAKIEKLERQVDELTKALEWHVGCSLKVMSLEEELIMRRVDEQKQRSERFGADGNQVAQQTCESINQAVKGVDQNEDRTEVG